MPLAWNDDASWTFINEQPTFACAPPYVGNGRIGLRLGAFVLGTDIEAPRLPGAGPEYCQLAVPRFDHSWPLQSFAAHGRDGFLYALPSWAQLKLKIGNNELRPGRAITGSRRPLTSQFDLRTGEAIFHGEWMIDGAAVPILIRLVVPRSCPHGGFWELELTDLPQRAELEFGIDGDHLAKDCQQSYEHSGDEIRGRLRTKRKSHELALGLRWRGNGVEVKNVDCAASHGRVTMVSTGGNLRLRVFYACHGGIEKGGASEVTADLNMLEQGLADGSLEHENERLWRDLWKSALDVTALPLSAIDQKFVLAQQYYLLASYDESDLLTPVIGLSGNQWRGAQLWDNDLWHGHALAIFWPQFARRIIRSRLKMLPGARAVARERGLRGAHFACVNDEDGNDSSLDSPYRQEIHVNAWAMLLVWNLWLTTKDRAVLEEGFPILSDVADFWCSRAQRDADGAWHIRRVLPPDEAVHENPRNPQYVDDSFLTNVAVRTALRAAIDAGKILGRDVPSLWSEVAEKLFIQPVGPDGVIPEYTGYNGHAIKQADVILVFFPLDYPASPAQIQKNLDYYHDRVLCGPLMTETVEAAIRLRLGRDPKERVLADLIRAYRRCVHGVFEVPYETAWNSNALMLTACGGLLSTLACSWWSYRQPGDDASDIPRLRC